MPWWNKQTGQSDPPEPVVYDDGGSGLFDACAGRFADRGWTVECDARHAVWVKSPGASYAVGLAPWVLDRYRSLDAILDKVEAKVKAAETQAVAAR